MYARQIDPVFYRVLVLVCYAVAIYILYLLMPVILPFVAAFVFAYILNPLISWLERHLNFRRWLAIMLVYLAIGLGFGLVLWWLLPLIWEQAQSAWKAIPTMVDYYNNTLRGWVMQHSPVKLPKMQVRNMSMGMVEFLKENYNITDARSLFDRLFLSGMNVINIAGIVVLVPILTFYFLFDWDKRLVNWQIAIPRRYYQSVMQISKESNEALMSFLKGQFLVMVILGVVYAVQLQLIGLDVGIIIGMIAGLASFVPYLGFTTGFIAAIVAGFFQFGMDWTKLGMIVGAFMIGQAVEGYVLQPLLLGDKIGLSALWVMFAVLAGAALGGIGGMLIALPMAAVLNVLCRHAYQTYLESNFYKGHPQLGLFSSHNLQEIRQEIEAKRALEAQEKADKREHGFIAKLKAMF